MTTEALTRQEPQALAYHHELTVEEVIAQADKIRLVMAKAMERDVHYGIVGTAKKPSLLKAGAEKLCLLFRLDPQYQSIETRDGDHLTVKSICTLWHIPTGQRFGSGEGSCTTRETKYAYRSQWESGKKIRIANPNLADEENTVLKMANKRALVAAVLNCTAASDVFTQDLEDTEEAPADSRSEAPEAAPPTNGSAVISEAQARRFHAIASGSKWSKLRLEALLKDKGIESGSASDIPRDKYEGLVELVKVSPA